MTKRTWGVSGIAHETEKAWWERKGYLAGPILGKNFKIGDHDDLNSPPQEYGTPEKLLWSAVVHEAVLDALKMTAGSLQICRDCHLDSGCTAFYLTPYHAARCKFPIHPVYQCARNWFHTPQAKDVCDILGIEIDYLRKLLSERIAIHEQASLHPGLPGEARGSIGALNVVRKIYRRKATGRVDLRRRLRGHAEPVELGPEGEQDI